MKPLKCPNCNSSFREQFMLNDHMKNVHSEKKLHCMTCDYKTNKNSGPVHIYIGPEVLSSDQPSIYNHAYQTKVQAMYQNNNQNCTLIVKTHHDSNFTFHSSHFRFVPFDAENV